MTLRRRIALSVGAGVAAIVVVLAVAVYLSVRSHLRGEIDSALVARTQPFLHPHPGGRPGPDGGGPEGGGPFPGGLPPPLAGRPPRDHRGPRPEDVIPGPPDRFGGAAGYFQFVHADGTVQAEGGQPLLPVGARDRRIARTGTGRYFQDETVRGTHLRVLTVADRPDHQAVQVARPLTEVDRVLHQLLYTFAAVIGAGVLLAALFGGLVGRGALRPIGRFIGRTENVSGALDTSERLEESGPDELVRLAASFNRTLDALERSVLAQRHLIADASHELRTPIAALRSNVQIFLEGERLPPEERRAMQRSILAELDELTQLVSDVVELARGERAEEVRPLRLDEVVEEAVGRTQRRAPGLRFEVDVQPEVLEHVPERVARAVTNLLDNARKWSPDGTTVEVTQAGGVVTVRDHGPGFGEGDLPYVFDRFYRAAAARRLPGSGLGLAIVRQAAEARGGWVRAANAEGGGAQVSACFGPARPPDQPEGDEPAAPVIQAS